MLRKISTWLDNEPQQKVNRASIRLCDHENCNRKGDFKAPKEPMTASLPNDINQWYFFCKEHVREYNNNWRYYRNMSEQEAYHSYRSDMVWNRPSWPIDQQEQNPYHQAVHDTFNFFSEAEQVNNPSRYFSYDEQESLKIFNLQFPFTIDELQNSYRQLVKENHPDLHQTDDSEEKIRIINQAYEILKKMIEENRC